MKVFLTSSPVIPGTMDLNHENDFLANLKSALPTKANTLFVASDPDNFEAMKEFGNSIKKIIEKDGFELEPFTILDRQNAEHTEKLVQTADFIILAGGHVPTQNAFFHDIHLKEALQNVEALIMGISAGSMNAADVVYAQPEEEGETLDPNYVLYLEGLDLTKTQIIPHYNTMKDAVLDGKRVYEDITFSDSHGHQFYVLPDGSYIICGNGTETIFGESYLVQDGEMTKIQENGESSEL